MSTLDQIGVSSLTWDYPAVMTNVESFIGDGVGIDGFIHDQLHTYINWVCGEVRKKHTNDHISELMWYHEAQADQILDNGGSMHLYDAHMLAVEEVFPRVHFRLIQLCEPQTADNLIIKTDIIDWYNSWFECTQLPHNDKLDLVDIFKINTNKNNNLTEEQK